MFTLFHFDLDLVNFSQMKVNYQVISELVYHFQNNVILNKASLVTTCEINFYTFEQKFYK